MRNKFARVPDVSDFKSPPGDLFHAVYTPSYMPDGTISLTVADHIDIKKEINSHREETDMAYILSRLSLGDDSVLNPRPPMYGDFTQFPSSYADILNMVISGEQYFNSLPLDIRNQFDNDRGKWFATIGSDSWLDAMGFERRPVAPVKPGIDIQPVGPIDKEVSE